MKANVQRWSAAILVALALPVLAEMPLSTAPATAPATQQPGIEVETHFSPEEVISPMIVDLIDASQHTLDIAAYAFTHPDISAAIIRAHRRGVVVRMVMDDKNASGKGSLIPELLKAGIEVGIRHKNGDQHSKYLVIDHSIIVTGSYNFTLRADERNSENLLVIRDAPKVADAFMTDYHALCEASAPR